MRARPVLGIGCPAWRSITPGARQNERRPIATEDWRRRLRIRHVPAAVGLQLTSLHICIGVTLQRETAIASALHMYRDSAHQNVFCSLYRSWACIPVWWMHDAAASRYTAAIKIRCSMGTCVCTRPPRAPYPHLYSRTLVLPMVTKMKCLLSCEMAALKSSPTMQFHCNIHMQGANAVIKRQCRAGFRSDTRG